MRHNARTSLESLRLRTHSAERATPPGAPLSIAIAAAGPARRNAGKGKRNARENIFHAEGRCAAFAAWNNKTRHNFTTMVCASSSKTSASSSRISSGLALRPKQEQM